MTLRVRTHITGVVGGPWENVLTFSGTTQSDADSAAAAVHAFWLSASSEMKCGGSIKIDPFVQRFDASTGTIDDIFGVSQDAISVTLAGTMLPVATQGRIDLRTGYFPAGREVKGRIFIPACDESRNDSGQPSTALTNNFQTWINTLLAASPALVVYSRKHHLVADVTAGAPWNEWAVLRSRRD